MKINTKQLLRLEERMEKINIRMDKLKEQKNKLVDDYVRVSQGGKLK